MAGKAKHCGPDDHPHSTAPRGAGPAALERAANLFRALAEAPRLRILELLALREYCVTEIVDTLGEKFPTVSQRLRILRSEGLVVRRRDRTHWYYSLADQHVSDLIQNAVAHALELETERRRSVVSRTTSPQED